MHLCHKWIPLYPQNELIITLIVIIVLVPKAVIYNILALKTDSFSYKNAKNEQKMSHNRT